MSKTVMLTLLNQGNTGDEILSILDAIMSEQSAEVSNNEPTADPIEFWSLTVRSLTNTEGPHSSLYKYLNS